MWKTPVNPRYITESIALPGVLFLTLLVWLLYDCGAFTAAFWRRLGKKFQAGWGSFKMLLRFLCGCMRPDELSPPKMIDEIDDQDDESLENEPDEDDPPDKTINRAEFINPHCGNCDICYNRRDCPMKTWRMLRAVYRPRLLLAVIACVVGIACTAFTLSVKLLPANTAPNTDGNDKVLEKLRSLELEYNIMIDLLLQAGIALSATMLVSRRMVRVTTTLTAASGYSFVKKIALFAFVHCISMIPALISIIKKWRDMANLHKASDVPLSVIWTALYGLIFLLVLIVCGISIFVLIAERRRMSAAMDNVLTPFVLPAENSIDPNEANGSNQTIPGTVSFSTPSLSQKHGNGNKPVRRVVPGTNQLRIVHKENSWYMPTQEPVRGCGCKCCSGTGLFQMDRSNKEIRAGLFSKLFFRWMSPTISLGYTRPLEQNDLNDVVPWLGSRPSEEKFNLFWQREFEKKGDRASLLRVLFLFCRSTLIRAGCLKLVYDCLNFVGPITLNILTKFLVKCQWAIYASDKFDERTPVGTLYLEGIGAALALVCANLTMTALLHQYFHLQMKIGLSLRAGLMGAIYSKSLRISSGAEQANTEDKESIPTSQQEDQDLSSSAKRSWFWKIICCCTARKKKKKPKLAATTTGEIVNLMAVDVSRLYDVMGYIHLLWSSPLQIIISLVLLWRELGPSTIAGVAIMCFSIPLTAVVGTKVKRVQEELMHIRDERIKVTNEVLAGMKIIKMYAWEDSFRKRVEDIRHEELKKLWKYRVLIISQRIFWYAVPVFVSIASFLTYVASGHTLDAATAFTSVSLFNTLRFPLTVFPLMLTLVAEAAVGARRLVNFLVRPEVKALQPPPDASMIDPKKATVVAKHLTLRWPNGSPLLDDGSFSCFPGTVTAIIGRTGAGKSGLLASLIGDVEPQPFTMDGKNQSILEINGRVAYVAQTAWIMNATLRENIVFGMPFNAKWYSKVVHSCALLADFEILPAGDLTEIGEKGVNLSGGQKQRVSLARAVYRSGDFPARNSLELPCDIYILDDCLSAVDSHVGQHIFEHAINGLLRRNSRTVIFVTHKVNILHMVDNIVFLGRRSKHALSGNRPANLDHEASLDGGESVQTRDPATKSTAAGVGIIIAIGHHNTLQMREDYALFTEEALREETESVANGDTMSRSDSDVLGSKLSFTAGSNALAVPLPSPSKSTGKVGVPRSPVAVGEPSTPVRSSGPSFSNFEDAPVDVLSPGSNAATDAVRAGILVEETALLSPGEFLTALQTVPDADPAKQDHQQVLRRSTSIYTSASVFEFAAKVRTERVTGQDAMKKGASSTVASEKAKLTEIEQAATGSVSKSVYLSYFRGFGGAPMLISVLCTLTVAQGAQVAANWWISYWSDHSDNIEGLPTGIAIYSALALTQVALLTANSYLFARSSQRAAYYFHSSLIGRLVRAPMSFFDSTPLGRIINRFSKDLYAIDQTLPQVINEYFSNFFAVLATFLVIIIATKWFALICLPVIYIYASIQRFYIPTGRQVQRIESILRSPVFAHFSETLDGVPTIRAYRAQERFKQENLIRIDRMQRANYALVSCNRWLAVRLETIGTAVVFSAAILAVIGGLNGSISAGVGGLAISYALNITQTLNWMVRMASDVETNVVSVERVQEYSAGCLQEAAAIIPDRRPPDDWPQKGSLELIDYKLRYRKKLPLVLKGISAKIQPSEKVGVVGRTGAGKSSLLIALLRIVEKAGGFVFVDDIDVSEIGLFDLRSKFSIIPQDPVLFTGTLRFNLDPFSKHTDDEVWRALERSHLKTFVSEEFEGGLEGSVEEGGRNLSMGQKQLLCLARALLRDSKILLLDEATSAVDPLTDKLIQETIRTYFADCTVLTIAHRIATIMDYDKILVLDNGFVKEFGPPMELAAQQDGIFRQLCLDSGIDVLGQPQQDDSAK